MPAELGRGLSEEALGPSSHALGSGLPRSESARQAVEEAILDEGRAARLALARRTAREALTDPGAISARRLSRLGPDGLARFIRELRHEARTAVGQNPIGSGARSAGANPVASRPRLPAKPAAAGIEGWWCACREDAPGFEARARRWGYATGALLAAVCVALLRLSNF